MSATAVLIAVAILSEERCPFWWSLVTAPHETLTVRQDRCKAFNDCTVRQMRYCGLSPLPVKPGAAVCLSVSLPRPKAFDTAALDEITKTRSARN